LGPIQGDALLEGPPKSLQKWLQKPFKVSFARVVKIEEPGAPHDLLFELVPERFEVAVVRSDESGEMGPSHEKIIRAQAFALALRNGSNQLDSQTRLSRFVVHPGLLGEHPVR